MLTHIKSHVLGYLALFLALAGTASASHLLVFSSDIVDGQVTSADVQNNGLTGTDIAENTLSVPAMGCQTGKLKGYARVRGTSGIPKDHYVTWSSAVYPTNNCSGGTVEVRRQSTGVYYVRFRSNPSVLALTSSNADGTGLESIHNDNFVTAARQYSGFDAGAFRVEVQDAGGSDGSDPQDGQFTIALL